MTMRMTRRVLVQRGAAGVTILSLPGLLAACGGGGGGGGGTDEVADVLRFSNWPLYIDFDEKTKSHPTLDQFTKQTGIKVDYFEDINSNPEYFGKIQGPLSQGRGIDRDIIVLTDNERFLGPDARQGLGRAARQGEDPEHLQPDRRAGEPAVRPGPDVLPAVAVRDDGDRVERERHGPVTSITQLFEDPKLKGKVTALNGMADTMGLVMLDNGDDPAKVTDATLEERARAGPERGRLGSDPAVHRQRLRPAAGQGRPRRRDRLVGGHLPAALVERQAPWAAPGEGRDDLDGQHDHPDGRERPRPRRPT